MPKRLSLTGNRQATSSKRLQSDERFSPYLSSVMECCFILDIDPSSCIPLKLLREIQDNAVQKLKVILTGQSQSPSALLSGFTSGSPTSIVVPLEGELENLLHAYWTSVLDTEEEVTNTILVHSKWYGIVDGNILHEAIMQLRSENPSQWSNFTWKVTVLRKNVSIEDMRRLARAQNERNKKHYTYEVTVFDLLSNLRMEYDTLIEERLKEAVPTRSSQTNAKKKPTICSREIAQRYDCGEHVSNTSVRQAASVAVKLSPRAIAAIGEVVNNSHPDLIMKSDEHNKHGLKTEKDIMGHHDCRLFKSFVCFGALRSAKAFMKALDTDHEEEQVNTVHRIRHYCESNNFKPVQGRTISEQFEFAKLARKEELTFLNKIGSKSWPPNMETARENLLRTTQCDRELESNIGNDGDVLTTLWNCFKSLYPKKAEAIEKGTTPLGNNLDEQTLPPTSEGDEQDKGLDSLEDNPSPPEEEKLSPEQEEELRVANLHDSADSMLKDAGIEVFEMPLIQFTSMSWSKKSSKADMVFSCITDVQDDKFIESLPGFCKLVMKPGSYVFLITTVTQFVALVDSFKKIGFKVCEHPFEIIYDVSTLQRRVLGDFPQKHGDIALLCCSPGAHPEQFHPFRQGQREEDLKDRDDQSNETGDFIGRAQFASLVNVTSCRSKLKRPKSQAPLFPWEKNTDVITRIIQTFSPHKGLVIDPYPGALSTALSCLKCQRCCVSISPDDERRQFAIGRLRIHAAQGAGLDELDDYSRPLKIEELKLEEKVSARLAAKMKLDSDLVESQRDVDSSTSDDTDQLSPPSDQTSSLDEEGLASDQSQGSTDPTSATLEESAGLPPPNSEESEDTATSSLETSAAQALVEMNEPTSPHT